MMFLVVAEVAVLLLGAASQGEAVNHWAPRDEENCYPYNETCGPIAPLVPTRYAATLEIVDHNYNITRYAEEIYDEYSQLLAVYEILDSYISHTIFFYKLDTVVFMLTHTNVEDGRAPMMCMTASISKDLEWFTAFPGNNGTHYAVAPSKALLFGEEFRYSFIENGTEREQPCNRWDACIPVGSNSFYVKYYWTDPKEVMEIDFYSKERPLTMRLTGTLNIPGEEDESIHLDEQYSFASFIDNPNMEDYRWAFEIPSGMYCPGLPAGKNPPTNLPQAYSARTELTMQSSFLPDEKFVTTVNIWYDYLNKIDRQDGIPVEFSQEIEMMGPVELTIIRDFRSTVEYVIDKTLGNCTMLPISFSYDSIVLPDGSIGMEDPIKILMNLDKLANLTYHGEKRVRGMPCEAWVGHVVINLGNGTLHDGVLMEFCLLQEGWTNDAGPTNSADHFSVPLFVQVQQDFTLPQHPMFDSSFIVWEHIFKNEALTPLMSTFDITLCFSGHDHIRRFQMAFPGQFREDFEMNPQSFLQQVEYSLVPYLDIAIIRLQQGLIEYDEKTNRLIFEFALVDRPQVDFELPDLVGPPLQEVVDKLVDSMDSLLIVLWSENYDTQGHIKKMYAISDSLQEMFEDSCVPPSRLVPQHHLEPEPEKHSVVEAASENRAKEVVDDAALSWSLLQKEERFIPETFLDSFRQYARGSDVTYTPGDMAGMGVGMALLGILLGWIIMMVILRKMGMSSDMEFIPMSSRRK